MCHDPSRTGAPAVLLHLVRWLRANTALDFEVVCLRDGPLAADFAAVARTTVLSPTIGERPTARVVRKLLGQRWADRLNGWRQRRQLGSGRDFGVLYLNTLRSAPALKFLAIPPGATVITHVHELAMFIAQWLPEGDWEWLLGATHRWIVPARPLKDVVVDMGAAADAVHIVQEFIEVPSPTAAAASDDDRGRVRRELGLAEDAFVVGASGTVDWRKGADLFVELAARWQRSGRDADTAFVWVGGAPDTDFFKLTQIEAARAGVASRLRFVPTVADPMPYYRAFDVFCLTSREDPFPLVCLEAAALSKPVVCFADAGGMPEFVEDDAGVVVPYVDLEAMATALDELRVDRARRERLGARGRDKVRERNDVGVLAPRIGALIDAALSGAASDDFGAVEHDLG